MEKSRRTMLNPQFAELYPELPVGLWVDAWNAAMQRAERVWFERGTLALSTGRVLSDEHFEFQGGDRRKVRQPGTLERLADKESAY
jgi:hypothetical protein